MMTFTVETQQVTSLVCDYLAKQGGMTADELHCLVRWWQTQGTNSEDIVAFLAQQGVIEPGCAQSMKMVRKGFLRVDAIAPYFNKKVADKIRQQLVSLERNTVDTLSVHFDSLRPSGIPTVPNVQRTALRQELDAVQRQQALAERRTEVMKRSQLNLTRSPSESMVDLGQHTAPPTKPIGSGEAPRPTNEIKVGGRLGKCILTEQIGKGGAGVVFRAIHQTLQITVAVKILRHRHSDHAKVALEMEQLRSEARILAQMNHPHVIRIFDFEEQPEPFLVLEYVEGLSLAELIEQAGMVRFDRALVMMKQTALALQAAQHAGIIHRDIKPANLLISRSGTTKLADLGLAVMRQGSDESVYGEGPVGTLAYMPPEQATSSKADFRSDIYSLGATFYHAITGRTLFPCRSFGEAMMHLVTGIPKPPSDWLPGLDPLANEVIMRMVAKDPAMRYPNYQELLDAFDELLERQQQPQPNRQTNADLKLDHSTRHVQVDPQTEAIP